MTYRTIVVGTDGSETATRAVRQAAGVAAADGARLVVVTAFEPHDDPDDHDARRAITERADAQEHGRAAREVAHDLGSDDVEVRTVEGPPAEKLIETAEDLDADLIVVGSVGLTDPAHFLLGSVASTVLHHAPADVLVVHTE